MALSVNALTTLNDTKLMAGIPLSNTTNDAFFEILINSVSAQVEAFLSRKLRRQAYDEFIAPANSQLLLVSQYPIQTVTFIKDNGSTLTAGTDYQVYQRYSAIGQVYRESGWVSTAVVQGLTGDVLASTYSIEASYTAGYYLPGDVGYVAGADNSLPVDISMCVSQMVAENYWQSARKSFGLSGISEGGLSYQYAQNRNQVGADYGMNGGMSATYALILNNYRRWSNA